MLDPKLKEYLSKGYAKIGEIAYKIALNLKNGKNHIPSQRDLYEQGIKMYSLLDVLFRHVTFDADTDIPILWRITEEQVNKFLRCLIELGELDKYPVVPSLFPTVKPIIINQGERGEQGIQGADGSNANIIVQLKAGEKQLKLTENIAGLIKTYELSFDPYITTLLIASIQDSKIYEIGTSQDFDILITSTKGTEDIITLICSDGTIDALLQPLVDLIQLNGLTQPQSIILSLTNQTISKTYLFIIDDDETQVQASDTVNFYYPYLFGASSVTGINPYSALPKSITAKSNRAFTFNDTDKYFYICYPASYGSLTSIKDQNGFEKISDFTVTTEDVTSSGLTSNWTVSYKVYRTTIKTSIANFPYTISY